MIIGNSSIFALESHITEAYNSLGFRAWGFFNIHINGQRYGVHDPDATMLACSLDEVKNRIAHRGTHTAFFAADPDAGKIANACYEAGWGYPEDEQKFFLGVPREKFREIRHASRLEWVPDGDAAFDDSSHVLQFDIQDRVRLIAFIGGDNDLYKPGTLQDLWLEADKFYDILERWRDAFELEWKTAEKT